MLIVTDRHTPGDLALWADLEAADRQHYATAQVGLKARIAIKAIASFADRGPCYAGISWGKDSIVLADLIHRSGRKIPLVYLRAVPTGTPDAGLVEERSGLVVETIDVPYDDIPSNWSFARIENEKDRRFFAAFKAVGNRNGNRHISGIRSDESTGRKRRMQRWGIESPNTLAPIGFWSSRDVFAYHATHDLATHPAYGMLGAGRYPREHLRVDELGGDRGGGFGRNQWEHEYYGDILRRQESRALLHRHRERADST